MATGITIYYKNGTTNVVPQSDVSYWLSQGWSTSPPTTQASVTNTTSVPSSNTQPNTQGSSLVTIYKNGTSQSVPSYDLSYYTGQGWTTSQSTTQNQPQVSNAPRFPVGSGQLMVKGNQTITVNDSDVGYFSQNGWTSGGTRVDLYSDTSVTKPGQESSVNQQIPGTSGTQQGTGDIASLRDKLKGMGVDITGLDDTQVRYLGMLVDTQKLYAEQNKALVPQQLTSDEMNKYLEQARNEMAPFYKEQFDVAKNQLTQAAGVLSGEFNQQQAEQQQQFQQQQEANASQAAEAGLARSGIRQQAEQRLQSQQEGLVRSQRRSLQNQIYGLGSQIESAYGQQGAQVAQNAFSGLPAQYNPIGIQTGSVPNQETVAEKQRQAELAQAELAKRQTLINASYMTA